MNELLNLKNVGKATLEDFKVLGIYNKCQLGNSSPDELFKRLQELTNKKHDPCVWDVFASAINEVKTGERHPWWHWTKVRKQRL